MESGGFMSKPHFLGMCLIDALENENLQCLRLLLTKHKADPNLIVETKNYAAVHYASGMENKEFSTEASQLIFGHFDGDPNVKELLGGMTPMHIAASNGNHEVFELMLSKGGNLEIHDEDQMTPLGYALQERHHEVLQIAYNFILARKEKRVEQRFLSPNLGLTANKEPMNLDPSSPYYIYITHRKRPATPRRHLTELQVSEPNEKAFSTPRKVNLLELTTSNLQEYSNYFTDSSSRRSRIDMWREKVYSSKSRESITKNIDEMERIVSNIDDLDTTVNSTRSSLSQECASEFFTASLGESLQLRRSPTVSADSVLQLMEVYHHSDTDNNIKFTEMRFHPPSVKEAPKESEDGEAEVDKTFSSLLKLPSDYGTEALREELTALGDPPGPITKTTKRLYLKKLVRYQRNPELVASIQKAKAKIPNFSVELINCLKMSFFESHFKEFMKLQQDMVEVFQDPHRKWREGHIKTSFIYLLIDPRVSRNLPAIVSTIPKEEAWRIFLQSIFYVGKGKSSRPYAHLYDAIRHFESYYLREKNGAIGGCEKRLSKKLTRIMEVWDSEKGVVCLHVFHNILPAEAFTREAALIDCLSLQHLTNQKRGDYYGAPTRWTMRMKKQMGVAILFNAYHVFLAEGENQLSPSDLI